VTIGPRFSRAVSLEVLIGVRLMLMLPLLAGCGHAPPLSAPVGIPMLHPELRIVVSQDQAVTFQFYTEDAPDSRRFVPTDAIDLTIKRRDTGQSMWEIVARSGPGAQRVTYGVAPPHFQQREPRTGPPLSLEPSVEYSVTARAGGGLGVEFFIYHSK